MSVVSNPLAEGEHSRPLRGLDASIGTQHYSPSGSDPGATMNIGGGGENRWLQEYQLLEQIGAGGMGTVYKAQHSWLGRMVAVKLLPAALAANDDFVARFRREAQLLGALDHPNIVRATDAGEAQGQRFLVTEYVDGADLSKIVRQHGTLSPADACECIRQAALALQHAHQCGLVHRDIKPSNLMLTRTGVVKLMDFGISRMMVGHESLTSTHQMMGTLDYMAPEQAGDTRRVDIRADIYSLGCTLFYLLAGNAPFEDESHMTPASKIHAHATQTPPDMDKLRSDLPGKLRAVLTRMLQKNPADRYSQPEEVARALEPWAAKANLPGLFTSRGHASLPPAFNVPTEFPPELLKAVHTLWWLALLPGQCCLWVIQFLTGVGTNGQRKPIVSLSTLLVLAAIVGFLWFIGFKIHYGPPPGMPHAEPSYGFSFGTPPEGYESHSNPYRRKG